MKTLIFLIILLLPTNSFAIFESYSNLGDRLSGNKGKAIYNQVGCIHCHGIEGNGDGILADSLNPKPRVFTSYDEMIGIPDSLIIHSIRNGIKGSAMPAHPNLSEEEINHLLNYIRTFVGDYYHTVNMCTTDRHTVNLGKVFKNSMLINDDSNTLDVNVLEDKLIVKVKEPINFIKKTFKGEKKTTRKEMKVIAENGKDKETIILSVRVQDCIRGQIS